MTKLDEFELQAKVCESWLEQEISVLCLGAGRVFFSGQNSNKKLNFDHAYHTGCGRPGIWVSESVAYAKDYCYFSPVCSASIIDRKLFMLTLLKSIRVLLFPQDFHPANALKKSVDGVRPDRYVSINWNPIVQKLGNIDAQFVDSMGHARYDQSGASVLNEVWIADPLLFAQKAAIQVPDTKEGFQSTYGTSHDEIIASALSLK